MADFKPVVGKKPLRTDGRGTAVVVKRVRMVYNMRIVPYRILVYRVAEKSQMKPTTSMTGRR